MLNRMIEGFKVIDLKSQMGFASLDFPAISVGKRVMTINAEARKKIGVSGALLIGINEQKEIAIVGVPVGTKGSVICNTSMKTKGVLARQRICEMILKMAGNKERAQFRGKQKKGTNGALVFDLKDPF